MSTTDRLEQLGNTALRTPGTFMRYKAHPKPTTEYETECFICNAYTKERSHWKFWRIIENQFPYDAVAVEHDMLVPVRHLEAPWNLRAIELAELDHIKQHLNQEGKYDAVVENLARGKSFAPHYHLHLIQWKRV